MKMALELIARFLIAQIFLVSAAQKIITFDATKAFMDQLGISGDLLLPVIVIEMALGIMIVVGLWTRWAALGLGLFCLLTAILIHFNWEDPIQAVMYMKNLTMAGGIFLLVVHGAGRLSLDHWIQNKKS